MRYYYAQIDGGRCVSVLDTHEPIDALDMVPLPAYDPALVGQLYDEATGTFSPDPAPVVPRSVTMRQARLALLGIDKLAAVQAALDALPEPDKTKARIWWEYSGTVERANPLVTSIGGALGLDLDALFTAAASL